MAQVVNIQNIQPHARIVIRNAVKELLKDNTDLGGRVFCSRPKAVFLNELPCGLIYFTDEEADHQNVVPRNYKRTMTLVTEVVHRLETERDNALDDFLDSRAFEIEQAMFHDRYLGLDGLVEDCVLSRTEILNIEVSGDMDIAALRIFWSIVYRTDAFNKGELAEFLRFITDYNTVNNADARDEVTIRNS